MMHQLADAAKNNLPTFVTKPLRSVLSAVRRTQTALRAPIRFSKNTGHFLSSLKARAVDKDGNPLPWYTYPAIDFLRRKCFAERTVLEFGSGQSTLWWAARARSVV